MWIPDIFLKLTSVYNHLPFSGNSFFKLPVIRSQNLRDIINFPTIFRAFHSVFQEFMLSLLSKYIRNSTCFTIFIPPSCECWVFIIPDGDGCSCVFWIFPLLPSLSSIVCSQYSSQRDPGDPKVRSCLSSTQSSELKIKLKSLWCPEGSSKHNLSVSFRQYLCCSLPLFTASSLTYLLFLMCRISLHWPSPPSERFPAPYLHVYLS